MANSIRHSEENRFISGIQFKITCIGSISEHVETINANAPFTDRISFPCHGKEL